MAIKALESQVVEISHYFEKSPKCSPYWSNRGNVACALACSHVGALLGPLIEPKRASHSILLPVTKTLGWVLAATVACIGLALELVPLVHQWIMAHCRGLTLAIVISYALMQIVYDVIIPFNNRTTGLD